MSERQQTPEVILDASELLPSYVNTCHLSGTPEELILDFAVNPDPSSTGPKRLKASNRLVMNYYTAKRLLVSLGMMVQRFEGTFGGIELEAGRRVLTPSKLPPFPSGEPVPKPEPES
jgi:hypothetical protein